MMLVLVACSQQRKENEQNISQELGAFGLCFIKEEKEQRIWPLPIVLDTNGLETSEQVIP
jgi:hypothetical protein